jgi:hypothetical protein
MEPPDQLGSDLEREACLACAAWARKREKARPARDHRDKLLELALAADERDRDDRQICCAKCPPGREVALAEQELALRADQLAVAQHRQPRGASRRHRSRRVGRRGHSQVEAQVLPEDPSLELAKRGRGLDPELVGQGAPRMLVCSKRLRLTAGPVEREHLLAA